MIEDLKPYPQYKDSGLPWLGEVPSHWETARSKRLFRQRKEFAQSDDQQLSATQAFGVIPQALYEQRTGYRVVKISMHLDKRKHVQADDFVISMRSFQGGLERAWAAGAIRSSYVVLEPSAEVSAGYFQHLFKSHQYINALRATSDFIRDGQDLNFNNFCGVDLPLIPLQEQAAIARFLVWATNRLDRAIRAKRRIIALLQEQKQAIIHRAVTRGLDPSEPLKDSGIPWLGEIPEHWEVRKIRAVASRVTKGTTPTTLGKQFVASGIRFVKVESISANRNILEWKCAFIDDATDRLLSRSKLRANDVVVSIAGAIGRPAIISPSLLPANTNQAVGIISPLNHLCRSEWLTYVLASPMCLRSLSDSSVQTAQANLSLTSLGRAAIGLPHVHEQDMIVARLSIVVSSVANTISRLEREIDLIREYRTRLIADVVTGKLDVREAAAGLPEPDNASDQRLEPEEEEPEFEAEDAQKESTD
jgi:type I restriction enzyme, S subunit